MKLAGKTDVGRVRQDNQDDYRAGELPGDAAWLLVCDGMGGARGGREASQSACDVIERCFQEQYASKCLPGVITRGPLQYVLLDTPGVHKARNKLGKRMDKTASDSIADVDVSMMLFEPYGALNESEMVLVDMLRSSGGPAIAVINKTDLVKEPADLEARKEELKALGVFDDIYTISVRDNDGCEVLFDALSRYAVEGPHYFDDDAYTDMPEKELVAEVIREKALLFMRDEIPHGIAVVVERFKERPGTDLIDIDVNIYCERESHKGMVIGKGGAMLKKIASAARADCEEFLGCRVNLQCWVKVKSDWRDNEFLLNNFGFKQNTNNR